MQKIQQLSLAEAQKIAAGEVVERPANVVKELIENALDAGATQISVYLEEGGQQLIRIIDNGCGMSYEDAHLCFKQHATSKIKSVEDLQTINTFGFRGEALASIAAVSKVQLITKEQTNQQNATSGIQLKLEAGTLISEKSVSCPFGTDINIENLFYNVPARQKFLKKKETEVRHITQLIQAFCLDHLHVHFKYFQNEKQILNCPATDSLVSRLAQLWDHTFAQQMLTLKTNDEAGKTKISGTISNHQYFRFDRNNIFLFVNKRWIKDHTLSRALLRGYQNVLPADRYPAAVIFITVNPAEVDINIHPRKEEVQFLHHRTIASMLQNQIKITLENNLSAQLQKKVAFKQDFPVFQQTMRSSNYQPFDFDSLPPLHTPRPIVPSVAKQETAVFEQTNDVFFNTINNAQNDNCLEQKNIISQSDSISLFTQEQYEIIGQYKKTYILLEKEDGLFLVDQHAAHERILYELFSKRFEDVATIKLMFPAIINLSTDDMNLLANNLSIFKENGIEIELFGENQLIVQSTPVHIKNISLEDLVKQVASWAREYNNLDSQAFFKAINEKLHAQMACKAAVKSGDTLTTEQMQKLIQDLAQTTNRLTCPHGRPTGWLLSLYEIEKKFKRIV